MKILVVEDQEMPWRNFQLCLTQLCGIDAERITRVRSREVAIDKIAVNAYDLVLLDHRILYREVDYTDEDNPVDFFNCLVNLGYDLIDWIEKKNPQAIIVGTSSFSESELKGYQPPELTLDKTRTFSELPTLVASLN